MNCRELREYLIGFLDDELDSALSIEVQRHLEQCPMCAREAEIERAIQRQLAHALISSTEHEASAKGKRAEDIVRAIVNPAPIPPVVTTLRVRRFVFLATAAVFGAAVMGVLFWSGSDRQDVSLQFADLMVEDFVKFQKKGSPLEIASSDPDEVSAWLSEKTALLVQLPALTRADVRLLGARKCKIGGKLAAFAVYSVGDELASVVTLRESNQALARMRRVEHNGHAHWVDHCKNHTVLACRRGELIYVVVSRLPEEKLTSLMPVAGS